MKEPRLLHLSRRDVIVQTGALAAAVSSFGFRRALGSTQKDAFRRVDRSLTEAIKKESIPGVVAMAATDKGIFYQGNFGTRMIGSGLAMTPDTVFWIASMTKAVTATAAMQLVEQGRLDLEQPMGQLLPELQSILVLDGFDGKGTPKLRPPKRAITLRHLLTHTAGFVYSIWNENMLRYLNVTHTPSVGESKNAALNVPIMFDPGDRWEYGISMDWVGKAIEAVSDQSLEIYFRERIFAPLGMSDSGFLMGSDQQARSATMYARSEEGLLAATPFKMPQRPEFFGGGGGLFSTPNDYMAFLQMQLMDGTFNGARLLKPETVKQMRKNHIGDLNVVSLKTVMPTVSKDVDLFPGMVQKWGLSFDINTEPGPTGRSAGSVSWAGLFNTYFWIDQTKQITGIFMTQMLPFADDTVLKLYAVFERGMYEALGERTRS